MNVKKLLVVLCALTLVFALAIPVFANAIANGTQTVFEGSTTDDLTVSVSVLKGNDKLYVNPYGLPYSIQNTVAQKPVKGDSGVEWEDADETIVEGTTTNGWFSTTSALKNESLTPLKVSVTMKSELSTGASAARVKILDASTEEVTEHEDKIFNCLWGNLELAGASYDTGKKLLTPDWDGENTDVVTVGVPKLNETVADDTAFVLDGADPDAVDNNGRPWTAPGYAAFRIRGSAKIADADEATPGETPITEWKDTDLVDVTVAFSFQPAGAEEP